KPPPGRYRVRPPPLRGGGVMCGRPLPRPTSPAARWRCRVSPHSLQHDRLTADERGHHRDGVELPAEADICFETQTTEGPSPAGVSQHVRDLLAVPQRAVADPLLKAVRRQGGFIV